MAAMVDGGRQQHGAQGHTAHNNQIRQLKKSNYEGSDKKDSKGKGKSGGNDGYHFMLEKSLWCGSTSYSHPQ
jgi:hypothetical protein